MKHRYVLLASATTLVAAAALWGCGSDNASQNSNTATATGGALATGASPGSGGSATTSSGGAGAGPASGSGGATLPAGSGGTSTGAGGMIGATGGAIGATGGAIGATGGAMSTTGGAGPMGGASGASGASGAGGAGPAPGSCGPESTIGAADLGNPMMRGPWTPTTKAATGPSGQSTLFYPTELGKGGVLHPVFHWGCGAGTQPSAYADHLNLVASYGFVVISNASGSNPAKASIDWLLAENGRMGSDFYQKLDPKRVGIGGHSLGALETLQSAADPRIGTYVLVCGGSGSGTTGAADIHAPSIFLGGEGESGTTNFMPDYMAITKAPSVFVTKTMTDHIYCARNNLGPWVAFMRWQLCGEDKWKKEFMTDGTYCKAPWLACQSKGFM